MDRLLQLLDRFVSASSALIDQCENITDHRLIRVQPQRLQRGVPCGFSRRGIEGLFVLVPVRFTERGVGKRKLRVATDGALERNYRVADVADDISPFEKSSGLRILLQRLHIPRDLGRGRWTNGFSDDPAYLIHQPFGDLDL